MPPSLIFKVDSLLGSLDQWEAAQDAIGPDRSCGLAINKGDICVAVMSGGSPRD